MKLLIAFIVGINLIGITNVQAKSKSVISTQSLPAYSKIYDEQRNPFTDATAALALAKKTHRNVLIEIGGNWCMWCHRMDAFLLANPDIYQTLHSKYVLLKVNVSDNNGNQEFMQGLPPVNGYPHMFVSDANGKMLLSKDTAELQDEHGYSSAYWDKFLQKWQSKDTEDKLLAQ